MKTTIIDNWLEPDLAEYLSNHIENNLLYKTNYVSIKGDKTSFLMADFPPCPLSLFLCFKLNKIKKINVLRCYVNLHYMCHGGSFHEDDGDFTFLYMPSKNVEGGEFEIKDEEKIKYTFNRLICFDAKKLHRGNPPINNVKRFTLAFKTVSI